eukprot:Seg1788.3 transcript_id=Seg1788.3/GoldUCD/mRNA.D3Y31 product="Protein EFFECTOR OF TRANSCRIPTION 3" protein_id=Seg1788.3/GoldUCD/D3Y31
MAKPKGKKPKRESKRPRHSDSYGIFSNWKKILIPEKNSRKKGRIVVYTPDVTKVFGRNSKKSGVYELRSVKGRKKEVVYTGRAKNFAKRMKAYIRDGSHLNEEIFNALKKGKQVEARLKRTAPSKAKAAENSLLKNYDYRWNKANNGKTR